MTDNRKLKIIITVPAQTIKAMFLSTYTQLISSFVQDGIEFMLTVPQTSNIFLSRELSFLGSHSEKVKDTLPGIDYTHILSIDSDMLFSRRHFNQLLEADKNIVSGNYKATDELYTNGYLTEDFQAVMHNETDIADKPPIYEVDFCGFGALLMKIGVLETMQRPWFSPFKFNDGCYQSEDISFCINAKYAGHSIHVVKDCRVFHIKEKII